MSDPYETKADRGVGAITEKARVQALADALRTVRDCLGSMDECSIAEAAQEAFVPMMKDGKHGDYVDQLDDMGTTLQMVAEMAREVEADMDDEEMESAHCPHHEEDCVFCSKDTDDEE